jgi:hypothetical protein
LAGEIGMKLDDDLKEEMLGELIVNPYSLHDTIKVHFKKIQVTRDRMKECSNVFMITQEELSRLRNHDIPFNVLSKSKTSIGEKNIASFIVGFSTLEQFHKAMRLITLIETEKQQFKRKIVQISKTHHRSSTLDTKN